MLGLGWLAIFVSMDGPLSSETRALCQGSFPLLRADEAIDAGVKVAVCSTSNERAGGKALAAALHAS